MEVGKLVPSSMRPPAVNGQFRMCLYRRGASGNLIGNARKVDKTGKVDHESLRANGIASVKAGRESRWPNG